MIDTIVIKVSWMDYQILDHNRFRPSTMHIASDYGKFLLKHTNNPTVEDKKAGAYKPRLTVTKRKTRNGIEIPLRIEFSIPKLVYNNNLDEVSETDSYKIFYTLEKRLMEMGVRVSEGHLRQAQVSAVHYSKNIQLTDHCTSSFALEKISKINLTKKLDMTKIKFDNDGKSLQFYSKSHALVIYDKISDLNKSKARAVDKDQTCIQLDLFDLIKQSEEPREILRIEARITNRTKLKSLMKKVGLSGQLTFEQIFSSELSKRILILYLDQYLFHDSHFIYISQDKPEDLLKLLLENNIQPKKALYLISVFTISRTKSIRYLRSMLESHSTNRTWSRISRDIKLLNQILLRKTKYKFVDDIKQTVDEFKPFKSPFHNQASAKI